MSMLSEFKIITFLLNWQVDTLPSPGQAEGLRDNQPLNSIQALSDWCWVQPGQVSPPTTIRPELNTIQFKMPVERFWEHRQGDCLPHFKKPFKKVSQPVTAILIPNVYPKFSLISAI